MTTTDKIHQTLRDSAGMRWLVLLLLAFAMFCSYIFMDILSPIKDLMQSTRGWDSTAFGTMQGSETFLNVFVFFLIFAGIILDKMGVRFTAILSGAVMLVGATINWYAVTDAFQGSGLQTWFTNNLNYIPGFDELGISPFYRGMPASAKFAAIGFMIFGCGVERRHRAGARGAFALNFAKKVETFSAFSRLYLWQGICYTMLCLPIQGIFSKEANREIHHP